MCFLSFITPECSCRKLTIKWVVSYTVLIRLFKKYQSSLFTLCCLAYPAVIITQITALLVCHPRGGCTLTCEE